MYPRFWIWVFLSSDGESADDASDVGNSRARMRRACPLSISRRARNFAKQMQGKVAVATRVYSLVVKYAVVVARHEGMPTEMRPI